MKAKPKTKTPAKKRAAKPAPQLSEKDLPQDKAPGGAIRDARKTPAKKRAARPKAKASPPPAQASLLPEPANLAPLDIADSRLLLPANVCALAFGISPQALYKWAVKPRQKLGRERLYYLPDLMAYKIASAKPGRLSLGDERARHAKFQADKTELEVRQMTGELIPAADVLATWEPVCIAARAKFLAIPNKMKTALPHLTPADIKLVSGIVRGALEDMANGGIPKTIKQPSRAGL